MFSKNYYCENRVRINSIAASNQLFSAITQKGTNKHMVKLISGIIITVIPAASGKL